MITPFNAPTIYKLRVPVAGTFFSEDKTFVDFEQYEALLASRAQLKTSYLAYVERSQKRIYRLQRALTYGRKMIKLLAMYRFEAGIYLKRMRQITAGVDMRGRR